MEMNLVWLGLIVWVFLLYMAYAKYRRQIAAVLSHQGMVKEISQKILAGEKDEDILQFMRQNYKISAMAASKSFGQIKQALRQRQAEKGGN